MRDVFGTIEGDQIKLRSTTQSAPGDSITFTFSGSVSGDTYLGQDLHGRISQRQVHRQALQLSDNARADLWFQAVLRWQTEPAPRRQDMIGGSMTRFRRYRVSVLVVVFGTSLIFPALAQHTIHVTPSTVQWGFFAADAKPVLTVKPGEVVTMDTICGIPEMLEQLGAATDDPIREMKEMYAKVTRTGVQGRIS